MNKLDYVIKNCKSFSFGIIAIVINFITTNSPNFDICYNGLLFIKYEV